MSAKDYVLSKLPQETDSFLPSRKQLFVWLCSNGGAHSRWTYEFATETFQRNHGRDDSFISSLICVLFTHNGVMLRFSQRDQDDALGFPINTTTAARLSGQRLYYMDDTVGSCKGAKLFVTDLPMKSFVCLDGTALLNKLVAVV